MATALGVSEWTQMASDPTGMSFPATERVLRSLGLLLVRLIYRVTAFGTERLPRGGFLLLPNHITWVDALILLVACPRPIRFVIDQEYYRNRFLHPILRTVGCIPITARRAKDAMRLASEKIRDGEIVCLDKRGRPQFNDPKGWNYVTAEASNGAVLELRYEQKGNIRPWDKTILIRVQRGFLREGVEQLVVELPGCACRWICGHRPETSVPC